MEDIGKMVFGVETKSGEKYSQSVELKIGGEVLSLPLFIVAGKQEGPTLAITAGIHGAEYASIEAALRLGKTLDPEEVYGNAIILPIVNMPAFKKRTIYVGPHDNKNLNRVFPGKQKGSFSETLAYHVFQEFILQANYYIDLHGGDLIEALVPFIIYPPSEKSEVNQASLLMAKSFGPEIIATSETPSSAIFSASQAGIPAILAEAGGQGIWNEDTVNYHIRGVRQVMANLGMLKEKPVEIQAKVFSFPWLYSEYDGLFYPKVAIGDKVSTGQKIGLVCDYFGKKLQEAISPTNGTVLFLVTALAINKGDPLFGIGGDMKKLKENRNNTHPLWIW
jgi:predicted deacylase